MNDENADCLHMGTKGDFAHLISDKEGLLPLIEQLRGGAKQRWPFDEVEYAVRNLWGKYGTNQTYSLPKTTPNIPATTLHRVRKLKSIRRGSWPSFAHELGVRKNEDVTDYGRCHKPQSPLCYCSMYEEIALAEIDAGLGDFCVIVTYRLTSNLTVVPIGEFDYYRRTGTTYLGTAIPKAKELYRQARDDANSQLRELVDAFFADEFIKPAHTFQDYKVTAALSSVLLNDTNAQNTVDAIFYPSVAFRAGYNLAIRPQSVHAKMELVKSETRIVRISDVLGYGIFELETLANLHSVDPGGNLEWTPVQGAITNGHCAE